MMGHFIPVGGGAIWALLLICEICFPETCNGLEFSKRRVSEAAW